MTFYFYQSKRKNLVSEFNIIFYQFKISFNVNNFIYFTIGVHSVYINKILNFE